jgi:Type I phosphodiesterase / nucleotide pyrophosphatase
MRFLRLLTNSLLAGALGAAYLTILVLQLNPQVPLASSTVWRWYLTLGLLYGVHLALLFYVTMLLREFVSVDIFSPGWISVRLLAWLSAAAAAVAGALMWLNLRGFPALFDEEAARRFTFGAAATTASAVVLLGIAIAHYSYGRRGSRVGAALLSIAIVGSLALPIAARGRGGEPPLEGRRVRLAAPPPRQGARIAMLLLDGASLEFVWPRVAAGRLPNFGRLLDVGASMDLATIRPTHPDPVWAAAATGEYPVKNGVRSAGAYYAWGDARAIDILPDHCFSHILVRLGIVRDEPNSSAALRARPLWSILGDYGISAGVARWPLTYPAEPIAGFLLTDRLHQMVGSMFEFDGRAAFPADTIPLVRDAFAQPDASRGWDVAYAAAVRAAAAAHPVQVSAVRYQAIDTAAHHALDDAEDGAAPAPDRRPFDALDRAYADVDREIGAALERLAAGDLLLVISGFGMRPVSPAKRVAARLLRDPDVTGTHEAGPDGFLLAYGTTIAPGRKPRGSIVDVTPTVLYFLGVPIGRDMDGYARADLFAPSFTADRPITFIPSHGG